MSRIICSDEEICVRNTTFTTIIWILWASAFAVRRDTHKGSTAGQPNRTNDCMWVLAATGNTQFQIESMLAVRRDTQAAIKTIGFEAHESNRSEETQLSSHRPCAPTCPATHTGQFRRHPRCYHRMHRETFDYIHHVTALRRIVIRTSKTLSRIICSDEEICVRNSTFTTIIWILWASAFAVRRDTHKGSTAGQPNRTNDCMWVLAATGKRHSITYTTSLPCVELSSERLKVLRKLQFWNIFTCTCAFRHSARQCFHSRTSKNAPRTTVF